MNKLEPSISVSALNEDNPSVCWYVYIIENRLGQLYTGVTVDPRRRLRQHTGAIKGGARALKGKGPLYFRKVVQVNDKSTALKLEYAIKRYTKAQKLALINDTLALPAQFKAKPIGLARLR